MSSSGRQPRPSSRTRMTSFLAPSARSSSTASSSRQSTSSSTAAFPPSYNVHHLDSTEAPPYSPELNSTDDLSSATTSVLSTSPDSTSDGMILRTDNNTSAFYPIPALPPANLSLSCASVNLMLTEPITFIRPPRVIEPSPGTSDGIVLDEGAGGKVSGFVYVVLTKPQQIKCLRVRLWAASRLAFNETPARWEDDVIFEKELTIGGPEGLFLEKGLTTWEFSFKIPSTAPSFERSSSGRVVWKASAVLEGSGSRFKKDLSIVKDVWVMVNPSQDSIIQFTHLQEDYSEFLGPYRLQMQSDSFVVGGPLALSLALSSPPPNLTIFAINVYIKQRCQISSVRKEKRVEAQQGAKKMICQLGEKGGYSLDGFEAIARKRGVVMDGSDKSGSSEHNGFWRAERIARLPNDLNLRPTTFPGTLSPMKYSSELTFEVVFNQHDVDNGQVKIATLFQKEVQIASCCCTLDQLSLPAFSAAGASINRTANFKKEGWCDEACMCNIQWDPVAQREMEALRGTGNNLLEVLRGDNESLNNEGLTVRRQGIMDGFDILRLQNNIPDSDLEDHATFEPAPLTNSQGKAIYQKPNIQGLRKQPGT